MSELFTISKALKNGFDLSNKVLTISLKVGSHKCHVILLNGSSVNVTLKKVKYVPELRVNLFRISKALKNGLDLSNNGLMIFLQQGSFYIAFYRIIKTVNGSISGIKMTTYDPSVAYIAKGSSTVIKEIDEKKFHEMIGHCGVAHLKILK
jgi:hypothetical protein